MNHAERPLFVMKEAVTAEIITIVTAPGQNCKSIGLGPMKKHEHWGNEQGDLGGTSERYGDTHVEAVLARGRERHGHFGRSAYERDDDEPNESRAQS
jgi:hypothetical protein